MCIDASQGDRAEGTKILVLKWLVRLWFLQLGLHHLPVLLATPPRHWWGKFPPGGWTFCPLLGMRLRWWGGCFFSHACGVVSCPPRCLSCLLWRHRRRYLRCHCRFCCCSPLLSSRGLRGRPRKWRELAFFNTRFVVAAAATTDSK